MHLFTTTNKDECAFLNLISLIFVIDVKEVNRILLNYYFGYYLYTNMTVDDAKALSKKSYYNWTIIVHT